MTVGNKLTVIAVFGLLVAACELGGRMEPPSYTVKYDANGGTFTKTGGTIYGYAAGDSYSNTVKNSSGTVQSSRGHAVYAFSGSVRKRQERTANPSVKLSFRGGASPTYSGSWDY